MTNNTTNTIRNASTVDVAIHSESVTYRAELIGDRVTVSRRNASGGWELAGHGDWTGERVDNCPADLGDEAWGAIDQALSELTADAVTLTAETITDAQIRALRTEAAAAGDPLMVEICDVALSPSPVRTLSLLVNGETVHVEEDHRALCADAINAGQG